MSLWWPGEWDRLISKFEDWILKKHGYSKMQPQRLSKGYQSLVSKPRSNRECITFRFDCNSSRTDQNQDDTKWKSSSMTTHRHSSFSTTTNTTIDIHLERCINSVDKMDNILKQYEKAFIKLPKRGPKCINIHNQNLDVLNEEVIQKIFLKCYTGNTQHDEIATK